MTEEEAVLDPTLSIADVILYLEAKNEEEVVGIPWQGGFCLLANSLLFKYPDAQEVTVLGYNRRAYVTIHGIDYTVFFPLEVTQLGDKFDDLDPDDRDDDDEGRKVTKAEVRQLFPELQLV